MVITSKTNRKKSQCPVCTDAASEAISTGAFMCCKKSPRSLGTSKAGGLQSRFAARRQTVQFCVGCCLTRVVEKVGSFENVSFMDVWLDSVVAIQVLLALIHLTTLYHLQPLRVVPAKLFTLNFLSPFFIIFLLKTNNQLLLHKLTQVLPRCSEKCFYLVGRE